MVRRERLELNLTLYPYFKAFNNAFFWIPVFILYFLENLTLQEVLWLEATYYFCVVLFEVPSGYFSDWMGRKRTLVISSLFWALSYYTFFTAESFGEFLLGEVFLAIGYSFQSGTDASFLYETLRALKRSGKYGDYEAKTTKWAFIAAAIASLGGGFAGLYDLSYGYGLSFVFAVPCFLITLFFKEPPRPRARVNFLKQCSIGLRKLRDGRLRWLFVVYVLMVVLAHIPYKFNQTYIDLLNLDFMDNPAPMVAGISFFGAMFIAALAAERSMAIRKRLGFWKSYWFYIIAQWMTILAMAVVLHPLVLVFIFVRNAPAAMLRPSHLSDVAPKIPSSLRASYLSIQSLSGRLCYSLLLWGLSLLKSTGDETLSWATLSEILWISLGVGVVGFGMMGMVAAKARR